ncbi:hypothetical protein D3C78_1375500 [compost metagenome]
MFRLARADGGVDGVEDAHAEQQPGPAKPQQRELIAVPVGHEGVEQEQHGGDGPCKSIQTGKIAAKKALGEQREAVAVQHEEKDQLRAVVFAVQPWPGLGAQHMGQVGRPAQKHQTEPEVHALAAPPEPERQRRQSYGQGQGGGDEVDGALAESAPGMLLYQLHGVAQQHFAQARSRLGLAHHPYPYAAHSGGVARAYRPDPGQIASA